MPPGPLPKPERRRRNAPTIPTTSLPASGRVGPVPKPPTGYDLRKNGLAWWAWAWKTPQACGWSSGDLYVVARRAQIEDDLGMLASIDSGDLSDLLGFDYAEMEEQVKWLIGHLKGLAANDMSLKREARELDDRLGLTPKGLAALRWTIVDDVEATPMTSPKKGSRYGHLSAVNQ